MLSGCRQRSECLDFTSCDIHSTLELEICVLLPVLSVMAVFCWHCSVEALVNHLSLILLATTRFQQEDKTPKNKPQFSGVVSGT